MSLESYKLTDAAIAQKGVVAAPDKLSGSAAENKAVFDRLIRESVKGLFNGLIDALAGTDGAGQIGTDAIEGVTGGDVQTVLGSLKTLLDTKAADADTTAALSLKSDKSVTDLHFKSVSLNAGTGVFTFTREDGSYVTVDTVLEKVATNWTYDAATQSLVLTLADGTTQSVPLSAFITETEFTDSDQIDFSVSNHTVTATVKAGSITDSMLASALVAQLQGYVSSASGSAGDALQYKNAAEGYKNAASGSAATASSKATEAESYAVGGTSSRTGEDTDNAKYYKEQAASSAATAGEKATLASGSASAASGSAEDAEAYAIGKRGGVDVESTDPAYHNNAKYYKDQASAIVGGDYAMRSELADKEAGATASRAYAVGEYLVYNDAFYKVTDTIAQGDTITPGTNVSAVKLGNDQSAHQRNGDIHVTAEQKTAWTGKQDQAVYRSVTLTASGWSGNQQTVTVTGVLADETKQMISPIPASASQSAYEESGVKAVSQAANSLTFQCSETPASNLSVYVVIEEVEAAT